MPDLSFLLVQALNGLASASSLFIISAGLTIVFGVTRIVNFAHGSFYMLGAYFGVTLIPRLLDVSNSFPMFVPFALFTRRDRGRGVTEVTGATACVEIHRPCRRPFARPAKTVLGLKSGLIRVLGLQPDRLVVLANATRRGSVACILAQ